MFNDARGALGLCDGASLARARLFTLVAAQRCLGIFSFLALKRDAPRTRNRQWGESGIEDQHVLMRWLQDSAAGLDLSKKSAILVGHGFGGWSLCRHLLQLPNRVDLEVPLFTAVIMQSGFCDDIQDAWRASQSEELFEPIVEKCHGRGMVVFACPSASGVEDILSLGGDILAYCSHWVRSFPHYCVPPQAKDATAKEYITCRACALHPPNSFWPWGVFSESEVMLHHDGLGSRGRSIGHVPVMLSRGDGAQGELELLACVCQQSVGFLA